MSPNFNVMQLAYWLMHSTKMATLSLTGDLLWAAGKWKISRIGSIGLTTAFDIISHSRLLSRLATDLSIFDNVLGWIESYLTRRTHYVKVGDMLSAITQCVSGVPQGSILGPVLFSQYISPVGHQCLRYFISPICWQHYTPHHRKCKQWRTTWKSK